MASEQREAQREERKREKDKKTRRIIWMILAAIVVLIVVLKLCEVDFSSVKRAFTGGTAAVQEQLEGDFPFSLDVSEKVTVAKAGSKLAVLTASSVSVLNPSDAEVEFTAVHGYSNPVLRTSDSYLVTYDQGADKLRLDYFGEHLYELTSKTSLLCADVADNGNVAYAAVSQEKRSDIYVLTKTQTEKLKYSTAYGFVTNIAISENGQTIAFVAMNSKDARLLSKLYVMQVGSDVPAAELDISGSTVLDLAFKGKNLYVTGNDFLSVVHGDSMEPVLEQGKMQAVAVDYTPSGELVLAYNAYNNSTEHTIVRVAGSGKIKSSVQVQGGIKDLSASSGEVSVLFSDRIVSYAFSDGEQKSEIKCSDAVRSVIRMSSNVYMQRQSLLEKEEAKS